MLDPDPVDHGLAPERTQLAWSRSGLAALICIAVLFRHIWPLHGDNQILALACVSAAAVVWAAALLVGQARSRRAGGERRLSVAQAGAITAATLALAVAAFVLGLFPPS